MTPFLIITLLLGLLNEIIKGGDDYMNQVSKTPEEMATEVIKAWIAGKSISADQLARELKTIYAAMIDAFYEATQRNATN